DYYCQTWTTGSDVF
nr:immunoglobulin light chain junction region [Macaca mulatta]MOY15957.1 immunoglobulin light chain junction region [Macaca mulatta]